MRRQSDRVLVRIFPVRRWIARICKRHAFGVKFQSKIKHSITTGLKVQRTFPLLAGFRQAVNAAAVANIGQRTITDLYYRGHHTPLPYRVSAADFLHPGNRSDRHQ